MKYKLGETIWVKVTTPTDVFYTCDDVINNLYLEELLKMGAVPLEDEECICKIRWEKQCPKHGNHHEQDENYSNKKSEVKLPEKIDTKIVEDNVVAINGHSSTFTEDILAEKINEILNYLAAKNL